MEETPETGHARPRGPAPEDAFHDAPVGLAVTDERGSFLEVNAALCELLGRSAEELASLRLDDVTAPEDVPELRSLRRQALETGLGRTPLRHRLMAPDGRVPVLLALGVLARAGAGSDGLVVAAMDATEVQTRELELIHRALHDPLTALPNRVLILDRMEHTLARLRRGQSSVAALFLDVDDFKAVNDRYGHAAGDHVLVAAAERLVQAVRPGDTVGRLGGDEFVVVCEDAGAQEGEGVASRIRERWQTPFTVPGGDAVRLTCSIGVAVADNPEVDAEQLLRAADAAMYRDKDRRRRDR